ncbi:MAG: hypothetical protein ACUVX1_14255 [Chloroflexota bacterium]
MTAGLSNWPPKARDGYLEQLARCQIGSWQDVARLLGVFIWDDLNGFNREPIVALMEQLRKVRESDLDLYLALEEGINRAILDAVETGFLAGYGLGRTSSSGPILPLDNWVAKSLAAAELVRSQSPNGDDT